MEKQRTKAQNYLEGLRKLNPEKNYTEILIDTVLPKITRKPKDSNEVKYLGQCFVTKDEKISITFREFWTWHNLETKTTSLSCETAFQVTVRLITEGYIKIWKTKH